MTPPLKDAELTHAFEIFDLDGDGLISAKEMRQVLAKLGEKFIDEQEIYELMNFIGATDGGTNCHYITRK